MHSQEIQFPGITGEHLSARLDRPAGDVTAYALFAHCFTCGKDIGAASRIARELATQGIAVLRFDFTGLGSSEGEFANSNFSSNVQDLIQASDFLREHFAPPSILIGHSLGGAAVLAAAGKIPEVKAVATIGAPSQASHVEHLFQDKTTEIAQKGEAEVSLAGRKFHIKKQFLDDIHSQSLTAAISTLQRSLLVLHSPIDNLVGIENAAEIFSAARHPRSFISLDTADHLLSQRKDAQYAAQVIASWAARYLPEHSRPPALPQDTALIRSGLGKFQQEIFTGKHHLLADEPASYGGDDIGPNPYDFLKIALGTCKSMTLRMYAERKKIPLEKVEVMVTHDKIHAEDCKDCDESSIKVDRFSCRLTLTGKKLSPDQMKDLLRIADRCPVHKTLSQGVRVETSMSDASDEGQRK